MDRENIGKELSRLAALVEGWCDGKPVDALERDLVLEKLRNVYEAIRFSESATEEAAVRTEPAAVESLTEQKLDDSVAESADLDLSGMLALEPDLASTASEELAVPADTTNPVEAEELVPPVQHRKEPQPAAPAIVSSPEPDPISVSVETFVPQPEPETISAAPRSKPESISERFTAPHVEVLAKPRSETAPAEQTATLFAAEEQEPMEEQVEEDDTTRHRRKQRVIMSLYGDGKSARTTDSGEERGMFEEVTVKTVASNEPIWDSGASTEKPKTASSPEPAPAATSASASVSTGSVLGEVINHDIRTLSDTIEPPRDMASSLRRKTAISDLRQAIGINDKFLLIRDLFDGDSEAYEAAMQAMNDAETLDDCMIYLTENYAWNADSDGVRLLMDLLERKFA
ncbi:MAG: hypothetical protein NC250_06445 [Alistipes senegalensis]|nr:hypothetical protein [Bacteroides cellulosilyticus]MCM1352354.1 hypothetical protein [Alistipes senegalensis]